ncbi:MAG: OmpA family protein, partial [Flammeovirgaceae bacterium]
SLQYIPDRGFSNSLPTGENMPELRETYHTFSTGVYWQQADRKKKKIAYWGVSLFDFNKPNDSFLGSSNHLSSTFIVEGGFRALKQRELSVYPEVLVTRSSGNLTVNTGIRFQYDVKPMPNQTPSARIDFLTKYVPGRSGIIGLQFHRENFSFGASYDFPFFVSNTSNLGTLEIGLEFRKLVSTKDEKIRAKRAKEIELRKKTANKIVLKNNLKPAKELSDSLDAQAIKEHAISESSPTDSATSKKLIEVQQFDSAKLTYQADAGRVNHEPYLVEKITLRFQFQYNSVDLDDDTEEFLNDLSKTLEANPQLHIKIVGHTDNVGSPKYNEKLSMRRAEEVKRFLTKRGINSNRIQTVGKGMDEPIVSNESEKNRALNRRVEILLMATN